MYEADISLYHMFGGSLAVLGLGAVVSGEWVTGLVMVILGVGLFLYGSATAPRPEPEDSPLNRQLGDEDPDASAAAKKRAVEDRRPQGTGDVVHKVAEDAPQQAGDRPDDR